MRKSMKASYEVVTFQGNDLTGNPLYYTEIIQYSYLFERYEFGTKDAIDDLDLPDLDFDIFD